MVLSNGLSIESRSLVGHQALVAKEILFLRIRGSKGRTSEASCPEVSPLAMGILGGTARIPEKVEFVGEV